MKFRNDILSKGISYPIKETIDSILGDKSLDIDAYLEHILGD